MLLAVFLSGIIVLRVLSTATAARATFLAVMIGSYFFECGCCCVFYKKGILLYNARNNFAHEILAAGLCVDAK